MACTTLTNASFQAEVLESKIPVLVIFFARWAGSCHIIAPGLREIADQYKNRIKFCKLDIDEYGELAKLYGINSIPTILLFKNGHLLDCITGVFPKTEMVQKLGALL